MGKLTKAERKAMQQERTQAKQERKQEKQDRREAKKSEPVAEVKIETPVKVAPIVQPVKKSEPKQKKASRKWNINLRSIPKGLLGLILSFLGRLLTYLISGLGLIIGIAVAPITVLSTSIGMVIGKVKSWLTMTILRLRLVSITIFSSYELKRHAVAALLMAGTFVFCYWIATL